MIVSEIGTKERNERAVKEKRANALDRVVERMMPRTSNKEAHEMQMLILRLLIVVVLPAVLILATIEYITTKSVNPLLTVIGTSVITALATLLKANGSDDKPKT